MDIYIGDPTFSAELIVVQNSALSSTPLDLSDVAFNLILTGGTNITPSPTMDTTTDPRPNYQGYYKLPFSSIELNFEDMPVCIAGDTSIPFGDVVVPQEPSRDGLIARDVTATSYLPVNITCTAGEDGINHPLEWNFTGDQVYIGDIIKPWLLGTNLRNWYIFGWSNDGSTFPTNTCNNVANSTTYDPSNKWARFDGLPVADNRTITMNTNDYGLPIAYSWLLCYSPQAHSDEDSENMIGIGSARATITAIVL